MHTCSTIQKLEPTPYEEVQIRKRVGYLLKTRGKHAEAASTDFTKKAENTIAFPVSADFLMLKTSPNGHAQHVGAIHHDPGDTRTTPTNLVSADGP